MNTYNVWQVVKLREGATTRQKIGVVRAGNSTEAVEMLRRVGKVSKQAEQVYTVKVSDEQDQREQPTLMSVS